MIEPTICLAFTVVGILLGFGTAYVYFDVDKVHRKRDPKTGRWAK